MHVGEFLKQYRENKGLTQKALAEVLDVNYFRMQKWEQFNIMPKSADADKIKAYFGLHSLEHLDDAVLSQVQGAKPGKGRNIIQQVVQDAGLLKEAELRSELQDDLKSIMDDLKKLQRKLDLLNHAPRVGSIVKAKKGNKHPK